MLASYIKLAWKVLGRRKFFTFISLFGVGFTLMVLVVAVALVEHTAGVQAPEVHQARMLSVHHVQMSGGGQSAGANVGERFVTDYLLDLPGVERVSYFTNVGSLTSRLKSSSYATKQTDGAFWKIFQFEFLEGGPFGQDDVRDGRRVAVITRHTADKYFGGPALGKTIEVGEERFRVVGVVRDVSPLRKLGYADIWVPLGTGRGGPARPEWLGGGSAVVLLSSPAAIPLAKQALQERLGRWQSPDPREFKRLQAVLDTRFEHIAREMFGDEVDNIGHGPKLWSLLVAIAACFLLLPTVNLTNLNVSRILERASEIGVRKSFGATGQTLVGQFLVENLVLTLLGAVLGVALAVGVMAVLSNSSLLPHVELRLNGRVLLVGLLLSLIFGVASGVYPAWRMSRLHPVVALKGGER